MVPNVYQPKVNTFSFIRIRTQALGGQRSGETGVLAAPQHRQVTIGWGQRQSSRDMGYGQRRGKGRGRGREGGDAPARGAGHRTRVGVFSHNSGEKTKGPQRMSTGQGEFQKARSGSMQHKNLSFLG